MPTQPLKALVFDAYGTIFDVFSVFARCEENFPGRGRELSQLWRTKQLEYTWLRSLMDSYQDFEAVTSDALSVACRALKLELNPTARATLMDAYLNLQPYPDVRPALEQITGLSKSILSNGSPMMLDAVVENAGLRKHFTKVISVDQVKIFKPNQRVYQLAPDQLGVTAAEIGFVSSNCWDAAGATKFGFKTFWINRFDQPLDLLGETPFREVRSLAEVAAFRNHQI